MKYKNQVCCLFSVLMLFHRLWGGWNSNLWGCSALLSQSKSQTAYCLDRTSKYWTPRTKTEINGRFGEICGSHSSLVHTHFHIENVILTGNSLNRHKQAKKGWGSWWPGLSLHQQGPVRGGHRVPQVCWARRIREGVLRHESWGHQECHQLKQNLRPQPAPPVAQDPADVRPQAVRRLCCPSLAREVKTEENEERGNFQSKLLLLIVCRIHFW